MSIDEIIHSGIKKIKKGCAISIMVLASYFGIGCGDNGGGSTIYYPETADSTAELTNAPDLIPSGTLDFWQNNTGINHFSAEANNVIDTIMAYFHPMDEEVVDFGANTDGLACLVEIYGSNPESYTDSNGNGNPDYVIRFYPSSTPGISQSIIDEIDQKLNSIPNVADMKQLIADYFVHNWGGSVSITYDIISVFLPLTGKSIPVNVMIEHDLGGGGIALNFTRDPSVADRTDIEDEKNLNGQVAGSVYTGVSADIVEPDATAGEITEITYKTMKYHEDNNL